MSTELFQNLTDPTKTETPTSTPAPIATPAQKLPVEPEKEEEKEEEIVRPDELTILKERAKLMNINFSNNIGIEALRAKINTKLAGEDDNTDNDGNKKEPEVNNTPAQVVKTGAPIAQGPVEVEPVKELTLRQYLMQEEMKLVRLRITNLDPKKKDLRGEIFTVANEHLGTVRKFVPYGEFTDNGYHVPHCIYTQLKDRKFLSVSTRKNPVNGQIMVSQQWAREFALDVLEPLTPEELARLGAAQLASNATESGTE